jgi:hypothetical protein
MLCKASARRGVTRGNVEVMLDEVDVDGAQELGNALGLFVMTAHKSSARHLVDICHGKAGRWPCLKCQLNYASYSPPHYLPPAHRFPCCCARLPKVERAVQPVSQKLEESSARLTLTAHNSSAMHLVDICHGEAGRRPCVKMPMKPRLPFPPWPPLSPTTRPGQKSTSIWVSPPSRQSTRLRQTNPSTPFSIAGTSNTAPNTPCCGTAPTRWFPHRCARGTRGGAVPGPAGEVDRTHPPSLHHTVYL